MLGKQFFGKITWQVLVGIVLMTVLAFFTRETFIELPLLILVGVITFIVTWRSLHSGLLIAFTEIFVGGHGHLLDIDLFGFSISIRMMIFLAVLLAWGIKILWSRERLRFELWRDVPWIFLSVAVVIGFLIGYLNNGFSASFDDMNGYLTIAYLLPLISVNWDNNKRRDQLQMFAGSVIWISGFTILLAYLFTHLDGDSMHVLYTFVRDSRLAEITLQVVDNKGGLLDLILTKYGLMQHQDYWYRIFMPSQLILAFGVCLMASASLFLWRGSRKTELVWLAFIIVVAALLLSLSRSFILGLGVSSIALFIVAWMFGKKKFSTIPKRTIGLLISGLVSVFVIWSVVMIPIPERPDLTDATFFETSAETGRGEAVTSRWNLLVPMMEKIEDAPVLGSGFGTSVTYTSDDPRLRAEDETGSYTTYRFEWGYHDIWLKMGLLGLMAFLMYLISTLYIGWYTIKNHSFKWIAAGLVAGVIALFVVHIFSPFLNHPLGIGFMLFVIPFLDYGIRNKKLEFKAPRFMKDPIKQQATITAARR